MLAIPKKLIFTLLAGIVSFFACADMPSLSTPKDKVEQQVDALLDEGRDVMYEDDSVQQAISILEKAYKLSERTRYTEGIINSCYNLGMIYLTLANNALATNYFYISMRNAEKSNNVQGIADSYFGLGLVMYNLGHSNEALGYFSKSRKRSEKLGKESKINLLDYLIGLTHFQLKNYDKAKIYLETANKHALLSGDSDRVAEAGLYLLNIKSIANTQLEDVALYQKIADYFVRRKEYVGECHALYWKARCQLRLGQASAAEQSSIKALKNAMESKVSLARQNALEVRIETATAQKDFESAALYLKELQQMKDSVNSVGETTRIAMMNAGYEFDKKESIFNLELKQRNKQRFILLILLGTALLAVFAIFFSLRSVAKQRKISENLLLNILPVNTAKELKKSGTSAAKQHEGVTIVFADVKSFTVIASRLEPQDLVKILDYYFGEFDAIVTEFGLEKIKTIGDAYMFVAGLQDNTNSAELALKASIKMLNAANKAGVEMRKLYGESFKFRFGIHTGNVVSGVVGHVKYAFDIWGDAVNIAARLEANSIPGKINVSHDTYLLVKDKFEFTPRGPIEMKNRGMLDMYFAERENA